MKGREEDREGKCRARRLASSRHNQSRFQRHNPAQLAALICEKTPKTTLSSFLTLWMKISDDFLPPHLFPSSFLASSNSGSVVFSNVRDSFL